MTVAAEELGASSHVGCLAHTTNLACGRALKITSVSHLLAKIRQVLTAILKEKQKLLQPPEHEVVIDVPTRGKSALNLVSSYLEFMQLSHTRLDKRENNISTLSERDLASAEELVAVLTPLKVLL